MASDGPTPAPCNDKIFKHGQTVCVVDGSSNAVERWVQAIAKKADAQVDWHYAGGRAMVLHLGDAASRDRTLVAIKELASQLKGRILSAESRPATVREVAGQMVLDDPQAVAIVVAVAKHNCKGTLELNAERVSHFKQRITDRNLTATDVVIGFLNVDDAHGGPITEAVMPGYDWQAIRDQGQVPFARGLIGRTFIQEMLSQFDVDAAKKLQEASGLVAVVVDHGVAEVFPV